jgi:hypothetical protein
MTKKTSIVQNNMKMNVGDLDKAMNCSHPTLIALNLYFKKAIIN